METNDLVTDSIEDAVTVKSEPYFICLEDNWITMESKVLVADPPVRASTRNNELHHDTIPPSTSGEHIEPDLPMHPGTHTPSDELIVKDEPPTDGEYFEPDLPSIKNEPLESESSNLFTSLDHHLWREHQPDPAGIGNMGITIRETSICRNSPFTGWHLLRATGLMTLILRSNN